MYRVRRVWLLVGTLRSMKQWTISILVMLGGVGVTGCQPERTAAPDSGTAVIEPERAVESVSAQVALEFFEAIYLQDQATLRRLCLPDADVAALIAGPEPSAQEISRMLREFRAMPVRHARAGETLRFPGLGNVTLTADDLALGRAVVVLEPVGGAPTPIIVVEHQGRWLVDARPFVLARQGGGAR